MVEEVEKMVTKEGVENSSSINNAGGEGSEAEEGEIVSGDLGDAEAAKALAPPPPRHSLEHAWTLWFDKPNKSKPLGEAPFALSTHFPPSKTSGGSNFFIYLNRTDSTSFVVYERWLIQFSIYNNVHHPSKLAVGADFHCFKNKIEPKWEDPVCSNGGKLTACFSRGKSDTSWLYTLSIGRQWKEFLGYKDAIVSYSMKRQRGLIEVPRIVTLCSCFRTRRGERNTNNHV